MRALVLLSVAVLAVLPFTSALPGPPTITIKIDQSTLRTNASRSNQPVTFTGSVTVAKSPYLGATVSLTSTVDKGWNSSVEPSSMTFTSTAPQTFTCTVTVPGGTPGATDAQLTVNGTVASGIFQNTGTASAMVTIVGTLPPPANQTGNGTNGTKPTNGNNQTGTPTGFVSNQISPGFLGFSNDQWIIISALAVIVVIASVALVSVRRRRKAALDVESVESVEEA